jgi:Tfp pilus assembly protein PilX
MTLPSRIRTLRDDESGFALVIASSLMALLATLSVTLLAVIQSESVRSRRDTKANSAYHAAEAGMNAYLSDLTESSVFPTAYMAKGEATRTDANGVAHAGNPSADTPWNAASWGNTWTYVTPKANDLDWFNLGNGYQYLVQVYPANPALQGQAGAITRIVATGRPCATFDGAGACVGGSRDVSTWRTIETMIRPSSLADFQTFSATSITYGSSATTYGPIFVGEDKFGNVGNLTHTGTAKANLYAEGTIFGTPTLQNGAQRYDKTTTPTAICKLNNCNPIPFSTFSSTITTVAGAAAGGGISLAATDPTNSALSGQSYNVDAWKVAFQSNGTLLVSSCKKYSVTVSRITTTYEVYDGTNPPVCGSARSYNVPSNGAIYSPVAVIVSGVVKGRVTVASNGNIVVGGDTTYAMPGNDVLGLEAQGTIYFAPYAIMNNQLTCWAATLSLNGPFQADPNWGGGATATFNFFGSTATYGGITMSNLFAVRNYNYDTNLRFLQPPYFPSLGNAYVILVQRQV